MLAICLVILHGLLQAFAQTDFRYPTQLLRNQTEIAVVVTNVYRLAFCGERNQLVLPPISQLNHHCGQVSQIDYLPTTQVINLAIRFIAGPGQQQSVDTVVDIIKVPQLLMMESEY